MKEITQEVLLDKIKEESSNNKIRELYLRWRYRNEWKNRRHFQFDSVADLENIRGLSLETHWLYGYCDFSVNCEPINKHLYLIAL